MHKYLLALTSAFYLSVCPAPSVLAQGSTEQPRLPQQQPSPQQNDPAPNPFPPSQAPPPPSSGGGMPTQPNQPNVPHFYGAIGFTADGSFATSVKYNVQAEAEASVAKRCSGFGRGKCEVLAFGGDQCVALSTFLGRRWKLSFARVATTSSGAQQIAIEACEKDRRTRRRSCNLRTVACADGR